MNKPFFSSGDLPTYRFSQRDELLLRQLEEAIGKKFFKACDPISRVLLSSCHWYFTTRATVLTLVIVCYTHKSYWLVQNALYQLATTFKRFTDKGNISIYPPDGKGEPWYLKVNATSGDEG